MTPYERIMARLKEVRPGWSERKASLAASDTPDLIRNIKRGRSSFPRGENLQRLAKVLEVSVEWLTTLAPTSSELSSEDIAASLDNAPHVDSMEVAADTAPLDPNEPMTISSEGGRRGIPDDATAQLDVTAGMGGGGLTIISDGIPGKSGMTFSAEHVRDFWRLPTEVTAALGLHARDVIVIPVQGDSMEGTLTEGDYVFVDTRHRVPSPDGIYCLSDDFGGLVVKRLEVTSHPRDEEIVIRIISDNPRHGPKERALSDIQIIGRVVRRFGVVG